METHPPNGWTRTLSARRTVLAGWDWTTGAITLMHGLLTFPASVAILGAATGILLWVVTSLVIAAVVGWRVIVDQDGFAHSWTWFGVPLTKCRFPLGTEVGVDEDPYAPDHSEIKSWAWIRSPDECVFGNAHNSDDLLVELRKAIQKHHTGGG